MYYKLALVAFTLVGQVFTGPTSNTTSNSISEELRPCYNESYALDPKSRAPATLNFFLDVLRQLEDANIGQRDAYYLSNDVIRKFRQDGIIYTAASVGLPFSAKHNEKNSLLQFGTLDAAGTPDVSSLTTKAKCTIHYLLSTSMNGTVRGDEDQTCRQTARYTSRMVRSPSDVELMSTEISRCPTESGVVNTRWGAVSLGSVISGIAAGFKRQATRFGDSLYINTISGDLANSILNNKFEISVGSTEGWDNTMSPKVLYNYPRSGQISEFTLTDALIRGSLDGFYLGSLVPTIKAKNNDIKISQLLDLYYSPRGLFNNSIAACNRQKLETTYVSTEKLTNETRTIMEKLNLRIGAGTLSDEQFYDKSKEVIDALNSYIPQLSDVACNAQDLPIQRKVVDLLIYVDIKWSYETTESVISYILNNVDINKYEGNYSIINGNTGETIVYPTYKLSHLYEFYNESKHTSSNSFDWSTSIKSVEDLVNEKYNNKTLGGKTVVAIFIPTTTPSSNDKSVVSQRYDIIKQKCPDLQLFVLGAGSESDYSTILQNPSKQFSNLEALTSSNIETVKSRTQKVLDFIQDAPRTIVNSDCSSDSVPFTYTVEPQGLNYYKLNPYFFYTGGSNKKIKIRELGNGNLYVCLKRGEKPTNTTGECTKLNNNETSLSLDGCSSFDTCESVFLSVEGISSNNYNCKDCRFPDSIPFQITLENTRCGSSATKIIANLFIMAILLTALKLNS